MSRKLFGDRPSHVSGAGSGIQRQHVELFRKAMLRRRMLRWAIPGAAYVPFIGDGDLAVEMYADRKVFGADLDPNRVAIAGSRIDGGDIRVADCDGWPFPHVRDVFAVADFDAYSEPYRSFRSWWKSAERADRLVLFFTDGHRQGATRTGHYNHPDGTKSYLEGPKERRPVFNFYLSKEVWPWFDDYVRPYHVVHRMRYLRSTMAYWGVVIEEMNLVSIAEVFQVPLEMLQPYTLELDQAIAHNDRDCAGGYLLTGFELDEIEALERRMELAYESAMAGMVYGVA